MIHSLRSPNRTRKQEQSPSPYLHEDALVDWTQQVSPERPGRKEIAVVDAQRGLLSPEERQEERRRQQITVIENELQDARELQTLQRLQVEAEEQQQQSRSGSVPHGAHELRYDRDREMEAILGEHVFCVQYWQRSLLALHASLIELCTQSRRAGDQGSGFLGPNGPEPAETRRTCTADTIAD